MENQNVKQIEKGTKFRILKNSKLHEEFENITFKIFKIVMEFNSMIPHEKVIFFYNKRKYSLRMSQITPCY